MANLLGQDIGLNYKGIVTIGSTINQNVSASLQSLTDGDGNALPLQLATGLVGVVGGTIAYTTGTNTRDVLSQTYTINNTGGTNTITGLKINATETSITGTTHNLLDLQVGGVTAFRVARNGGLLISAGGATISSGGLAITGGITVNDNNFIYRNGNGGLLNFSGDGSATTSIVLRGSTNGTRNSYIDFNALNIVGTIGGGIFSIGNQTPSTTARLLVRGDGTNTIGRFEHSDGTAALLVTHTPNGVGLQTSGSWTAYNNSTAQLVGIQGGIFYIFNTSARFQINLSTNEARNLGNLFLGSISVASTARLQARSDGTNPIARFENSAGSSGILISTDGLSLLPIVNNALSIGSTSFQLLNVVTNQVTFTSASNYISLFSTNGGTSVDFNVGISNLDWGFANAYPFRFKDSGASNGFRVASGDCGLISLITRVIPNSGTASFTLFNIAPTINQTGGANGVTRGLYVAPTLTSAADFRAIETLAGSTSAHKLISLANAGGNKVFEVNAAREIGLFGATPIAQPTTAIAQATLVGGGGASILEDDTFAGYTVAQVVQALVNLGILKP